MNVVEAPAESEPAPPNGPVTLLIIPGVDTWAHGCTAARLLTAKVPPFTTVSRTSKSGVVVPSTDACPGDTASVARRGEMDSVVVATALYESTPEGAMPVSSPLAVRLKTTWVLDEAE